MNIEGDEMELLKTVSRDVISKVGMIVMEYSLSNLKGCGLPEMTLGTLPWLDQFTVQLLSECESIFNISNPAEYSPEETNFILSNRVFQN